MNHEEHEEKHKKWWPDCHLAGDFLQDKKNPAIGGGAGASFQVFSRDAEQVSILSINPSFMIAQNQ